MVSLVCAVGSHDTEAESWFQSGSADRDAETVSKDPTLIRRSQFTARSCLETCHHHTFPELRMFFEEIAVLYWQVPRDQ